MSPLDSAALDQAFARAGDGVCITSSDGRIMAWNRSAERILGYTAREVLSRPCCDVFVGRDEHGNRMCHPGCHVMTLSRLNEPIQHFDMLTQAKGGRTVWLDVSVVSIATNGRTTTGTNGIGHHGNGGQDNGFILMHMFRDVTTSRELLAVVRERFASAASADGDVAGAGALTRREIEVLRLVAQGGKTKAVAEKLHVSPATIRNHVQNILGKLGAHSRLEAVAYAHRHRLL